MSRPSRQGVAISNRERLKADFTRGALLRDLHPQLAEVRVEMEFQDGTTRPPSAQSYSYFPAARGFFRYACPCHGCDGELDLTAVVTELAGKSGRNSRTRDVSVACGGQRIEEANQRASCPVCAQVRVSAVLRNKDSPA